MSSKLSALGVQTAITGATRFYVSKSSTDYATLAPYAASIGSKEGVLVNGNISVSVASSNITVAIKDLSGSDPSSTSPVCVKINGTVRTITSALYLTVNAGTNYFTGATNFAALARQYFVYLTWVSASSQVAIAFSPFPFNRTFADGSSTTTNQAYFPHAYGSNTSVTPTSTDACVLIGRFTATLSGAAAYQWSISGTGGVINRPIYSTDNLTYTVTWTSSGTQPAIGNGTSAGNYRITDRGFEWRLRIVSGSTTTYGTGTYTFTIPFTAATFTNGNYPCFGSLVDISAGTAYVLILNTGTGGSSVSPFSNGATGVTATSPITLATGDIFSLTGTALLAIP